MHCSLCDLRLTRFKPLWNCEDCGRNQLCKKCLDEHHCNKSLGRQA